MKQIELLGTLGCHLCELAEPIVYSVAKMYSLKVEQVDIADDPKLTELYGIRIPVVRLKDDTETPDLGWPFDESQFEQWLHSINAV